MPQPTALEQFMLELVNAERKKAGAQPLAFDSDLNQSADGHNAWMIAEDTFSHTGSGGRRARTSPGRACAARAASPTRSGSSTRT